MILLTLIWCSIYVLHALCVTNLKYFETFSDIGIETRVKRYPRDVSKYIKQIKFKVFNRQFHLHLKSGMDVLAKNFKAFLIQENDKAVSFYVDQKNLFTGYLIGDPDVRVSAHVVDNWWSIQIFDRDETYAIEPSRNLLTDSENPKNESFIAYRASDLINTAIRCGTKNTPETNKTGHYLDVTQHSEPELHWRNGTRKLKRDSQRDTCLIQVFADYLFFRNYCRKSPRGCTAAMITMVQNVDILFRSSPFQGSSFQILTGYGLQIESMAVYTTYSLPVGWMNNHFNERGDWTAESKLKKFITYMRLKKKKYCLSTLFSGNSFPDHVLGLATTGSICSKKPHMGSNVVSAMNGPGLVPSLQMNLVLAHGHNFGSEHDPYTPECSAPEYNGGNFLMWPIAVTGHDSNNQRFSPCSLKHIGRKLESASCFVVKSQFIDICGNSIVDIGEQCDEGDNNFEPDSCCDATCRFRKGAICSDSNTLCCLNCTIAPNRTLCFDGKSESCKKESFCNGKNHECEEPDNLPDWTPCLQSGKCYNGTCRGFCEMKSIVEGLNLQPCLCISSAEDACKWCCYDNSTVGHPGPCQPYSNESVTDGRKCYAGLCKGGVCLRMKASSIMRLVEYLKGASLSRWTQFMRSNIVIIVIFLSLLLYVPLVRAISKLDDEFREMLSCSDEFIITKFVRVEKITSIIKNTNINKTDNERPLDDRSPPQQQEQFDKQSPKLQGQASDI